MSVLLDTGSNLFWVRGKACNSTECTAQPRAKFDPSLSSTYSSAPGKPDFILYDDKTAVNCTVGTDSVHLGGKTITGIGINPSLIKGPPGSSRKSNADFFANFLTKQAGPASVAFWYNTNPEDLITAGHAGSITFGGVESSRFTGPMTNFPIITGPEEWSLKFDKATMGGADLPLFNGHFLFDTGTTKVLLPKKMASEINKQIKAIPDTSARGGPKADEDPESDEDRVIDCATGPSLPAVNFFFAGIKTPLTLSGKQLYFNQIGEDKKVRWKDNAQPIIGALFLRSFYTNWDFGNAQIGFAQPVPELPSDATATKSPAADVPTNETIANPSTNVSIGSNVSNNGTNTQKPANDSKNVTTAQASTNVLINSTSSQPSALTSTKAKD